jgi:hypothetical protein
MILRAANVKARGPKLVRCFIDQFPSFSASTMLAARCLQSEELNGYKPLDIPVLLQKITLAHKVAAASGVLSLRTCFF